AACGYLPASSSERLLARIDEFHQAMDAWDRSPAWPSAPLLRRDALQLAALAGQAAFVCVGGRAHDLRQPVHRLAREASFYATTQLTSELKDAFLSRLEA